MAYPREEVEAAVRQYIKEMEGAGKPGGDILDAFNRVFTEDIVYVEHEFGTYRGRQMVIEWVAAMVKQNPVMADIVLRFDWYMIEGNRAVLYHHDGFPDPRGNGTFAVPIVTIIEYAGNGRWSYNEDLYNGKELERCLAKYLAAKAELQAAR